MCLPSQVILNIDAPGAVITWDFDVMKQDISFSVLSIHKSVESIAPVTGMCLTMLSKVLKISAIPTMANFKSI